MRRSWFARLRNALRRDRAAPDPSGDRAPWLRPREYEASEGDLLYHYCGAEAFQAICSHRTLRFGDLHAMNDFAERLWGYSVWEEAASELLDIVGKPFLDDVDEVFHKSGLHGLALASCLSKNGDLLSQWRAYADDGAGYAVGFSAEDLSELPASLLDVSYDREAQVREVAALVQAIYEVEHEQPVQREQDFLEACLLMATDTTGYKNPAFSEEQEVRLVHLLGVVPTDGGLKFEAAGGKAFGREMPAAEVGFRLIGGVPSPYLDIDFSDDGSRNPIRQVVLGPKNQAGEVEISLYLETIGLSGVGVVRSEASYR